MGDKVYQSINTAYLTPMSMLPPSLPTFIPNDRYSIEQWQDIERITGKRYEYHDGYLVSVEAMAGGSFEHARIGGHFIGEVRAAIIARESKPSPKLGCDAFTSDLRIAIDGGLRYLYADATVVCGSPVFDEVVPTAIANPVVVCEVISPSSEGYDRALKFDYYSTLDTLREYVIIWQNRKHIEVRYRSDTNDQWQYCMYDEKKSHIVLPSLDVELPISGLYRNWEAQK